MFYLSLALGFLAKGPLAWVPLLTVASTIFYAPNLQLGRRFKFVRGIALMLAIIAAWGIPALIRTHGDFLRIGIGRHVIGRSFGAMEGHGWNSLGGYLLLLPFYFVTVFVSFFPWSIKLPALLKRLWRERDNIDNYLLSGVAIIFIIFSVIKTKLPHYTLPGARGGGAHRRVRSAGASACSPSVGNRDGKPPFFFCDRRRNYCVYLDCIRAHYSAAGRTVFSGVSAPSGITRFFEAEHAICLGGVRGAESCLVFSLARERVSHAIKRAPRYRIYELLRAAFYHSADACCRISFFQCFANLEIFYSQRIQRRQRQACRPDDGAETGVIDLTI